MTRFKWQYLIVTLAVVAGNLFAVDGVVLIDQNRALAGGITPGDTPGFPITITQPGSYKLVGNLTVPIDVNGIKIAATFVTLDLNGFTINCSSSGGNVACISETGTIQNITIRNGGVSGDGPGGPSSTGVSGLYFMLSSLLTVEDLHIGVGGGIYALATGPYSIVRHNAIVGSKVNGQCPSLYVENVNFGGAATGGGSGCVMVNNIGSFPAF